MNECPLEIKGRTFNANLLKMPIRCFDVIIGMDWLYQNKVVVDCFKKEVIVEDFSIHGSKSNPETGILVSALEVVSILKGDGKGYLAYLLNKPKDQIGVDDIEVVKEFKDVFPKELDELPPAREIEFIIDLVPRAQPFSKTPYRMARAELKELRSQREELL